MTVLELSDNKINPEDFELGVIIGRFQVNELHEGHRALIDKVISNHRMTLLLVGVPQIPNTKNNPLDYEARYLMLKESYPDVTILPLKDKRYDEDWAKQVDDLIFETFGEIQALLYGSRDSFIPHYEPHGEHVTVELITNSVISGTEIRNKVSNTIIPSKDFRTGLIRANHLKWDITYPTVDVCAINKNDEILLARKPNEKLFRFIGGFVDPSDESLEAAAVREFSEETGGTLIDNLHYITSARIDDWRYSKINDGIMTTLFLGTIHTDDVTPTDDIEELKFFKLKDLNTLLQINETIVPEHVDIMVQLIAKIIKMK